jgi:type I restriction enzyme S subunit
MAGTSTNVFDDGNVLYSKLRPYLNKVICPTEPGIATTELVPLRPRKDLLDRRYLTYYLRSNHFLGFANVAVAGVKMPRIIMTKFWKHQIPLPTLFEQRRIVEILDQADQLRKKRAEADAKAARILPALFYKMFGDPATNPRNWNIKSLDQVIRGKPQYGANASAVEWLEGMPRYVRITDITQDGRLSQSGVATLDLENWEPYRLVPGDLLFTRSGNTVGKTYLYRQEDGLCAYAGYLIRFQADPEQVTPWYLFSLTQTGYYKSWVEARKRVAGQPNINGKEYSSLQIPCPPLSRQQEFTTMVESLITFQNKRVASKKRVDQLFNIILHRAFTGDLTVKWREAHMKELLAEMETQAKALETVGTQP